MHAVGGGTSGGASERRHRRVAAWSAPSPRATINCHKRVALQSLPLTQVASRVSSKGTWARAKSAEDSQGPGLTRLDQCKAGCHVSPFYAPSSSWRSSPPRLLLVATRRLVASSLMLSPLRDSAFLQHTPRRHPPRPSSSLIRSNHLPFLLITL